MNSYKKFRNRCLTEYLRQLNKEKKSIKWKLDVMKQHLATAKEVADVDVIQNIENQCTNVNDEYLHMCWFIQEIESMVWK